MHWNGMGCIYKKTLQGGDEWRHTTNVESARPMLQLWPAEEVWAETVV